MRRKEKVKRRAPSEIPRQAQDPAHGPRPALAFALTSSRSFLYAEASCCTKDQGPTTTTQTLTTMSSQAATIRPATRGDISTIIHLIRELAIYEKEPQAAKATPELIEENIFQKEIAKCLIAEAEVDGKTQPIGLAIVSGRKGRLTVNHSGITDSLPPRSYLRPSLSTSSHCKCHSQHSFSFTT